MCEPPNRHGKGGTEGCRRGKHQRQTGAKADDRKEESWSGVRVRPTEQWRQRVQFERQRERERRDDQFERGVGAKRLPRPDSRRDHAANGRARGESPQKRRDDRACGSGGVADVEGEKASPADFVDEPRESGAGVRSEKQQ